MTIDGSGMSAGKHAGQRSQQIVRGLEIKLLNGPDEAR